MTALSLRRQPTQQWAPSSVLKIIGKLSGLRELHYELWREWDREDTGSADRSKSSPANTYPRYKKKKKKRKKPPGLTDRPQTGTRAFHAALPSFGPGLSKLVLFEDFSEAYPPTTPPNRRAASEGLATAAAALPGLQHLSASFLAEAGWFLPAVAAACPPPRARGSGLAALAALTLTSGVLAPGAGGSAINNLLGVAAAVAPARLPGLRLMEVWNGGRGVAGVFRYQVLLPGAARITWRAMWDVELEPGVVGAWEAVERGHGLVGGLEVVKELLGGGVAGSIRSHGDAICQLGFEHDVCHPISLSQIRRGIVGD